MLTIGIVLIIGSIVIGIVVAIVIFIKNSSDDDFQRSHRRTEIGIGVGMMCIVLFFIGIALIILHFLFRADEALSLAVYLGSLFLHKTGSPPSFCCTAELRKDGVWRER